MKREAHLLASSHLPPDATPENATLMEPLSPLHSHQRAAVSSVLERHADQRIDLADACLVWLAGIEKTERILTTDRRDFVVLRTPDGRPFERLWAKP